MSIIQTANNSLSGDFHYGQDPIHAALLDFQSSDYVLFHSASGRETDLMVTVADVTNHRLGDFRLVDRAEVTEWCDSAGIARHKVNGFAGGREYQASVMSFADDVARMLFKLRWI